jgi:hypothetical protein
MRPAVRTVTGKLGEQLAVRVPKERWTFFTARVCVAPTAGGSGMDAFCTELYGAVWRSDGGAGGELVRFDARDGAAVAVLRRVQRAGLDPEGFNVRRFMEEYRAVAGDRGWALDREALVSALEGGGFRVTALRLREFFPVSVVVPPGRWLPDRPGIHMIPQSAASEYGEGYRISAGLTREEQDRRAGQGARASSGLQDYVLPSGIYSFFESDTGAVYRVRVSSTGEVLAGRFR